MKKLIFICCLLVFFSGCTKKTANNDGLIDNSMPISEKYLRINLRNDTLGEEHNALFDTQTEVIDLSKETFSEKLPIYEIKDRIIPEEEFQEMLKIFGMENQGLPYLIKLKGNKVDGTIASYDDPERGYFDDLQLSDEELEQLAWDTLNKIPFITDEYEYRGIATETMIVEDEGEIRTRVGVRFCRLVDGIRVVGNDECLLCFDGSGLVEVQITLFDYEQVGTMDMVELGEAESKIKTPDALTIDADEQDVVDTLHVDCVKLLLFNQHSRGCTILQPVYDFIGTATLEDGTETGFSSMVIAIPESYTYEAE